MKLLTTLVVSATLAIRLAVVWTFWTNTTSVLAHEVQSNQSKNTKSSQNQTDIIYSYIAQPGDSYTKMARKAVQTYGLKNKINLSGAQIIFAETNLTKEAGSPLLDLNQKVEIKESAVHTWVDKAVQLTKTQQDRWNFYVQFVNFNTDNVGESKG
jgi:hypothetical protein